jgi:Ca2+-dependent lipid-binding protein
MCGAEYDNNKYKTKTINDNGFNPFWDDSFDFQVFNPDLALLRFVVYDVDIFGDSNFIGQYTTPMRCLRSGYRSIPLKNAFSEDLELSGNFFFNPQNYQNPQQQQQHNFYETTLVSALLVHVQVTEKSKTHGRKLTELRNSAHELLKQSELSEAMGDEAGANRLHEEAQKKEHAVMNLLKKP